MLQQIFNLRGQFHSVAFEGEKVKANQIARDMWDVRFQSYLVLGGPTYYTIEREAHGDN